MLNGWKYIILLVFIILGLAIYGKYDPAFYSFFPKCPFYSMTGYKCLGCGAQRATHQLLQGNIIGAFQYNALFVMALPYILINLIFDYTSLKNRFPKVFNFLFGYRAIYLVIFLVITFWIGRFVAGW